MHNFGENSSYVTIFLYLNWTEATKIEWKLWHVFPNTFLKLFFTMHFNGKIENGTKIE
jgi:hypothetical protein